MSVQFDSSGNRRVVRWYEAERQRSRRFADERAARDFDADPPDGKGSPLARRAPRHWPARALSARERRMLAQLLRKLIDHPPPAVASGSARLVNHAAS